MKRMLVTLAVLVAPTAVMAQPMTASTYLMKAGASDLFERQSATVMASSTNPSIKSFASMMLTDHTKSTADVKAAARAAKLTPKPPMLTAKQSSDLAALKAATGTARDDLYVTQQKAAHDEALSVQQGFANEGKVASLRTVAGKIVPVVQHHIEMLKAM